MLKWLNDEIFYPALHLKHLLVTSPPEILHLNFQKEGWEILNKMEEGLKRFDNEPSCHLPEILQEVRTLQKICNEKGAANGNISFLDGAKHFLNSDLEGCGKRGIAFITRLTTSPLFPDAEYYENPSDKTKPEIVREQPVEQQSQKKIKPLTKDEVKRAKWILKMKKRKYKYSPITDETIAQIFNTPEAFPKTFRPNPNFDRLTTKQGVFAALKKYASNKDLNL